MITDLLIVCGVALAVVAALMTVTALVGKRQGRVVVVDVSWGFGFVLIALASAITGTVLGTADPLLTWLLVGLVGVWGLRLTWHTASRLRGHTDEDPRYAEMLDGAPFSTAVRRVFVTQGAAMWFVSLPVQITAVSGAGLWPIVLLGIAVFVVGFIFETVGDAQLSAYKRDPDRPKVMDRGLWGWTRHPNYFGDACVWWGLWLISAEAWPGVLTVLSPVAMTYFLAFATGARLLERRMAQRPGYPEYMERTSMFFPLPPRQ